jgi:signal transduction histidine kinase
MEKGPERTTRIADLRKAKEQLRHSQLLATLGEMLTGIANEVNNPLGSILLYSELLMAGEASPQTKEDLKVIHDEARRAARAMTDLLNYYREDEPELSRLEINSLLNDLFHTHSHTDSVPDINITLNLQESPLLVKGNLVQLNQLFTYLIINAEEVLTKTGGGNITVTTRREGAWLQVLIADNGPGIPPECLERIFYPFFTTRQAASGTGLGLSTCYKIVTSHKGLIHAENNEAGGATFTVELPLADSQEEIPAHEDCKIRGTLVA